MKGARGSVIDAQSGKGASRVDRGLIGPLGHKVSGLEASVVKGFVAGVLWGGVVAGAGLGVVSVMAPMKPLPAAELTGTPKLVETAEAKPADAAKPAEAPVEPEAPKVEPDQPKSEPVETALAEPKPEVPVTEEKPAEVVTPTKPDTTAVAEPAPETTPAPEAGPEAKTEAPAAVSPAPGEAPATSPVAETPVPEMPKAVEVPAVSPSDTSPSAEQASLPETETATNESLLTPAPAEAAPKPATITPDPVLPKAQPAPELSEPKPETTLAPAPGLKDEVAGVTTGRLPTIGAEVAEPQPEVATDLSPYRRYAQSFDNASGKPLFSILLIDPGTPDLDRAQLAALGFPVTFAVDPLAANAAEAAATYRAAGQEVLMLATGIPKGAKASDLEQTFAAYAAALPEAVAVLDLGAGGFQEERGLATDVVGLIKAQGRGVLTYDRGLNAADQVARRDGVPAGLVFRSLDDEGEDSPLIRRYLDRAAFKAAQEGRVVVVGTARPETIAALLEWAVEGRASSVALAPATAVLSVE